MGGPHNDDVKNEPKPDVSDESVVPPNNISGTYLIGCEAIASASVGPYNLKLACQVQGIDRSFPTSSGIWTGQLIDSVAGEELKILDASQGLFQLEISDANAVTSTLARTLITFAGQVNGQDLKMETRAKKAVESSGSQIPELKPSTPSANQPAGQVSATLSCPNQFVQVPGDTRYGTSNFCIMKYEAKDGAGSVLTTAARPPWVNISQANARLACQALGPRYDLISNDEWMSVGANIAGVARNWSAAALGQGFMSGGHSDSTPAVPCQASGDDLQAYFDANCLVATDTGPFAQRRTHELSNGSIIWDLAGNVSEWTTMVIAPTLAKPFSSTDQTTIDFWREWTEINSGFDVLPLKRLRPTSADFSFWNETWNSTAGIGKYLSGRRGGGALQRGGNFVDLQRSGIFAGDLSLTENEPAPNTGFRCVFHL